MGEFAKTVGLVSCCGPKRAGAHAAQDLYTSDLFRKSVAYLRRQGVDEWLILSAEHGLVLPTQILEPYDRSLAKMPAAERRAWAERTRAQIVARYRIVAATDGVEFVVLGGKHYVAALDGLEGVSDPLKGMQIGERLRFLKAPAMVE